MLSEYIKTREDWWAWAEAALRALPEYAADMMRDWDEALAQKALAEKDHATLHAMAERLWSDLPDHPGIHRHPFGMLCDLCSEYWVFEEDPSDA